MLKAPNMLMVGATGRNVGKTNLACSLLERLAPEYDIVGVKVSTVTETEAADPQWQQGHGACLLLETPFLLTRETSGSPGKDTSRLLEAGAKKVYWLRVVENRLEAGAKALLETLGHESICICESNSLRKVIEPGLFVAVEKAGSLTIKPSAQQVRHYADAVLQADTNSCQTVIDCVDGTWLLRPPATAIIMAGGRSRRMGRDKSTLPVGTRSMIEVIHERLSPHFQEVLIGVDRIEKFGSFGLKVVPDKEPGQGPLMALASCLEASSHELNLVVACDMPQIDTKLARRMLIYAEGYAAVVPSVSEGRFQPFYAVYRKGALQKVNELLSTGERRLDRIFDHLNALRIPIDEHQDSSFGSLNTWEEYQAFLAGVKGRS